MATEPRPEPVAAADVTDDLLQLATETLDSHFPGVDRIDWEDFIDALSDLMLDRGWDEFSTYDSPAIAKIKRHVRRHMSA